MKKDTVSDLSGRRVIVRVYDARAKELLEYVKRLDLPWREGEELKASIASLRETLAGFTAFVGLIVSEPPPKQKAPMDGLELGYKIHGGEFCDWFNNLHCFEVREAEQGTTAYRLIKIMPFCMVEKVTFLAGAWLSDEEITKQAVATKTQ